MGLSDNLLPIIITSVLIVAILIVGNLIIAGLCTTGLGGSSVFSILNPPTNLNANAVSTDEIDLTWSAPSGSIIGYDIEYSFNTVTWITLISNTGSTAVKYNATGLISSSTYYFRVSAISNGGTSAPSNIASDTTFGVPGVPTNLAYTSPLPTEIDLTWTAPITNGGDPIQGYKLERAFPAGSAFTTLVANTGNVTSWHDTSGITSGTTFSYRISTINNVSISPPSAPINATSDPPAVSNSTGSVVNGIALCPAVSKLLSLNSTNGNGSMIIIANTQFQTTSTLTKSVNVYLNQNSTVLEHNQQNIRLGTINTNNDYTILYYTPSAIQNSHYQINACTNGGTVNGIAKMDSIYGKTNVMFINGTLTSIGTSDTVLGTASTSFPTGNNVIIANLGLQSTTGTTAHFTSNSFKIKNTGGTVLSSNNMGLDMGSVAPTSTQYGLLIAGESNAPANAVYTFTALKPVGAIFDARVEMLVLNTPQLSFTNAGLVNVGLATTPLASTATGFSSNSTQMSLASTWYNNTSSSPVKILAGTHLISNGTTLNSNSFDESPFFNAGNFGDTFTSSLFGFVSKSGTNPTYTVDATANNTGIKSATQLIAFQISGSATSTPTNLKANTVNKTSINLSWSAPTSNGGFPITGYTIMQETPVGGGFTKKAVSGNFTTYTIIGLTPGTQYNYKIAALNAGGNSTFSSPANNYTITDAPTNLIPKTFNSTEIKLSWTAPSGTKTGYKIERETPVGGGFGTIVANTGNTLTNYNDTGLITKTVYNYRVSAINAGGTSQASISAQNQTSDSTMITSNGHGVLVTSVCPSYTSILNITGTGGSNIAFVNGQFSSNSGSTKQAGFKIVDDNNGVILAANKTSLRLSTANTWSSYLLIGSESVSPANPVFKVYACTSGNSILAKARAAIINGYSSYVTNTGAVTTVHYYDINKVLSTVTTTSPFSSGPNVIIANIGMTGNSTSTIRLPIDAIKIYNVGTATDLSHNQLPLYTGVNAPTSSPSIPLIAIDNNPGTTPTYEVVANSGNNTSMQASMAVLHVAGASYDSGSLQTLALDPSSTTLNSITTSFVSGASAVTFTASMFNNTSTTHVTNIPASDYQLKENGNLLANNTFLMRGFNPAPQSGDMFSGMHMFAETLGAANPTFTIQAASNTTGTIQGYAQILSFILTANQPTAPQSLTQTEVDNVTTTLNWSTPSSNGGSPITGYEIDYHRNQTGSFSIFATVGNVTTFTTHARVPGYPYVWEVKAINGIGTSVPSNVVKTVPMMFSSFTPTSTTVSDYIVNSRYTLGDQQINSFSHGRLEHFPRLQHAILFCSVSTNTTAPKCGQDTIVFERNAANASPLNANPTTLTNFPIQYMWYDNEENNDPLSTPTWEWKESTCPAGNICDPAYWVNLAATTVHSYQVGTKGYNYKFGVASTADMNGTWQHNPSKIYCYDYVALGHHPDNNKCGLLWNELTRVNWANVEIGNIQSQRWIGSPNTVHAGDNPPCDNACAVLAAKDVINWIMTNSSGHTVVGVQINTENSGFGNTENELANLQSLKGFANNTAYYFSNADNTTAFMEVMQGLKR